jgi:hypothetical protein
VPCQAEKTPDESDNKLLFHTGNEDFRADKCSLLLKSGPDAGTPSRFRPPGHHAHALPPALKNGIFRKINCQNITSFENRSILRTIAHFVKERFDYSLLVRSSHFAAKKVVVSINSMPKKPFPTKIFM